MAPSSSRASWTPPPQRLRLPSLAVLSCVFLWLASCWAPCAGGQLQQQAKKCNKHNKHNSNTKTKHKRLVHFGNALFDPVRNNCKVTQGQQQRTVMLVDAADAMSPSESTRSLAPASCWPPDALRRRDRARVLERPVGWEDRDLVSPWLLFSAFSSSLLDVSASAKADFRCLDELRRRAACCCKTVRTGERIGIGGNTPHTCGIYCQ